MYLLFFWTGIPMIIGFISALKLFIMSEREFAEKYPDR